MSRGLKTALAVLAGVSALGAAVSASAATPSLVGIWSHRVTHGGQAIAVIWDQFSPDGQLHMRFVTPKGTIDLLGSYQMVSSSVVRTVLTDWSPKQTCTMVCTPNPSPMPIGQPGDSTIRWAGPNVVYFGADMYTRQQ